jgi:hypothetical protein
MKWVLLILAALPLLAEDPWAKNAVSQLDEKQVTKLLNNSPWAKDASVWTEGTPGGGAAMPSGGGSGRRGSRGGAGASAGVPSASEGSMGPPIGGNDTAGMGGSPPPPSLPKILVRWQSAKPLLEGLGNNDSSAKLAKMAEQNYIVLVGGISLGGRPGPDGAPPDAERIAQVKKRMADATALKRKGHEPLHPAAVEPVGGPGSRIVIFLFPRTDPIDLDDKEITFESAAGPMKIKAKFALKDMMYQGQLAL